MGGMANAFSRLGLAAPDDASGGTVCELRSRMWGQRQLDEDQHELASDAVLLRLLDAQLMQPFALPRNALHATLLDPRAIYRRDALAPPQPASSDAGHGFSHVLRWIVQMYTLTGSFSRVSASAEVGEAPAASSHQVSYDRIAWHDQEAYVSVVANDGGIYTMQIGKKCAWLKPPLRSSTHGAMSCVAARPFCAPGTLAAGFRTGWLGLWMRAEFKLFPASHALHSGRPVARLSWNADGSLLASSAAESDGRVVLWRPGDQHGEPLRAVQPVWWTIARQLARSPPICGPASIAFQTPTDSVKASLSLVGAAGRFMRVWSTDGWHSESVSISGTSGTGLRCSSWSPSGRTLLIGADQCIAVLRRDIQAPAHSGRRSAPLRLHHVESTAVGCVPVERSDGRVLVGGTPKAIAWDTLGERIAVMFAGECEPAACLACEARGHARRVCMDARAHLICVYAVQEEPQFRMLPLGYIKGPSASAVPLSIQFRPLSQADGSILAVLWSSQELTLIPFLYSSAVHRRS
ncbi:Aladin [Porphyridium purpureum]|uniref:Aladin n=1 Tax=Porphyridium purpureum TaxID=35688 RepID=A0A5J4YVT6_PORPP|nr:Aladin [Porphyridium purpureum]|eukprot:POR3706..scf209_3